MTLVLSIPGGLLVVPPADPEPDPVDAVSITELESNKLGTVDPGTLELTNGRATLPE